MEDSRAGEEVDEDDSDYEGSGKKKKRGKKRKAKDTKKASKKKKKRKADSDLSDQEFAEPAEEVTPKRGRKKKEVAAPAPANDGQPDVAEICELYNLNDVDLEYSEADYQNLTTYRLYQITYKDKIQAANPKVREIIEILIEIYCELSLKLPI